MGPAPGPGWVPSLIQVWAPSLIQDGPIPNQAWALCLVQGGLCLVQDRLLYLLGVGPIWNPFGLILFPTLVPSWDPFVQGHMGLFWTFAAIPFWEGPLHWRALYAQSGGGAPRNLFFPRTPVAVGYLTRVSASRGTDTD